MDRVVEESGLRLTVPEDLSCRPEELSAYQCLSGTWFCEMDVLWWDEESSELWACEWKDHSIVDVPDHLLEKLVAKATDTLLLLAAVYLPTDLGTALATDMPEPLVARLVHRPGPHLVFVIKTGGSDSTRRRLRSLRADLKARMNSRVRLMAAEQVTLVDEVQACGFLPIEVVP